MATWRKVIVSGSGANLATLQVDNLTSGQVVIGGGTGNLSSTAVNGTGTIVATTGATGLSHSGSFSGSFSGPLTGTASFASNAGQVIGNLTQGTGITTFTYNGASAQTVAVSGASALTTNAHVKWSGTAFSNSNISDDGTNVSITGSSVVISGSLANLRITGSVNATLGFTGSFTGSFKGDGSGLTGVTAGAPYPLTFGEGIGLNAQGSSSYGGTQPVTISVSGAADLTNNIITKWDNTNNKFAVSSLTDDGTTISGTTSIRLSGASSSLTGSFTGSFGGALTGTASFASKAGQLINTLTLGNGLTGTSFDGSANVTATVGAGALIGVGSGITYVQTSSLTTNQIPKLVSNTLSGSNISDDGTTVTISKATTISAGGISVTGNSTFSNNLTVQGDLTVAGTASFQNTQNLLIGDRFAALASGSTSLTDGGIIIVGSTTAAAGMSGSAFYLEVGNGSDTGAYGRFAVAPNVHVSASTPTVDEWIVTAKQSATAPGVTTPTWGGNTNNAAGNMWIDTTAGNIYIWA